MSIDTNEVPPRNRAIEWPTLALIGVIYASFFGLTWFHAAMPWWLWLVLASWTSAWWGSVQHEILHGHPTSNRTLNTILATPPFWLWLPFERYRRTHLTHHRDERLTDPLDDPESRYLTPDAWHALGPVRRALLSCQGALLGRLVVGPPWVIATFVYDEMRAVASGDRDLARVWFWHGIFVALTLLWIIGICGVPFWLYALGFVYMGTAVALIRSFAEHRAHETVERRTAVVENSPVFGLLFLSNNLHAAHHRWPTVAWYRLPALYRAHRSAILADNGGLLYSGYGAIFRRFFLRRHDAVVHPGGRVPAVQKVHAGAG